MKLWHILTINAFRLRELQSKFEASAEQTGVDSGHNEADLRLRLHIHTLGHGRGDSASKGYKSMTAKASGCM